MFCLSTAAAYPPDVLADDGCALLEQLGLSNYDLGGYSLGARTVVRLLGRGATPGRAIVAGMGLEGIIGPGGRSAFFRRVLTRPGSFERGSPEWMAEAFLKTVVSDPEALAAALPIGRYAAVPGNHMSAVSGPDLGEAIAGFLND